MVGTVSAIAVAMAPVTKMEIRMTHMISCSEACKKTTHATFNILLKLTLRKSP